LNVRGLRWLKGYVKCSLKGKYIELFINATIKNKLPIWDVRMVNDAHATFFISLDDFFKLKPILRKTFTLIHVEKRIGFPFLLDKLLNRKGIFIAFFLFFLLIFVLSRMIWSIDIVGNKLIKEEVIEQTIQEIGIHRGVFKYQLPETKQIQDHISQKLEQAAWIGVKVQGTNIKITVVEKVKPEEKPLVGPRNIVSSKNAIIYRILAEKGLPKVKVHDRVKKGDILISGVMGSETNSEELVAKGTVEGIVWYESNIELPLILKWKEYTGNYQERNYIFVGNRMLRINGSKQTTYTDYKKTYDWKRVSWKDYQLPVGIISEKVLEYQVKEQHLSKEEAVEMGVTQARSNLMFKLKQNSEIKSEKVLHQTVENDKVTIKILFEVLEDITDTQPIIQGD